MEEFTEISKSDCYKVIAAKLETTNFKIVNYQQNLFAEKNGYLGEHSSLKITIGHDGKTESFNFFVKSLPKLPSQRNFLLEIKGFFKETQFFNKYCPLLKKHSIDVLDDATAECYFTSEESLIFEDLKSQGYETLEAREPMEIDCVKAALVTMAKLHASGLILEETESFRLSDKFSDELTETFYAETESVESAIASSKHGIKAVIDLTHEDTMKISKDLFLSKSLEAYDLQKSFVKPSKQYRNTICHVDPWTKNFMFKFEDGKPVNCVLVDFQTYRYGPPAQDVMVFFHLVTDRQFRDQHMEELLHFYFDKLQIFLGIYKDVVTIDEFFDSCHYFKQFALLQTIAHFQIVILSEEIASELLSDPDEMKFVMFQNKYNFMVTVCKRDPIFRKMHFAAIAELREFFESKLQ